MTYDNVEFDTRENEQESPKQKTCNFKGVTYLVMTDMDGKDFIEAEGQRIYLDRKGRAHKTSDTHVKTAISSFEDMKKVQDYFLEHEQWNFYLLFTLNVNTGRRISDIRASKWCDFFDEDGNIRKTWNVKKANGKSGEQKTGKRAEIYINEAVKEAFELYMGKEEINLKKVYRDFVFRQLHGTHKGSVISAEGYRQALMKAEQGLDYEIRSHSMRRGMGSMMLELHPNDPKAKSILMELYNHSSEKMTNKYIGETAKLEEDYLKDFGEKYKDYVIDGKEVPFTIKKPVSTYDNAELRDYMMCAFAKILDNANETDPIKLMKLYNELLDGLEEIAK